MGKKSVTNKSPRSILVVLHQEGYSKKQISFAEKGCRTAVHNAWIKFKILEAMQTISNLDDLEKYI